MNAEVLRRAASLMRERAEAAIYVYAEHHPKAGQVVPWFDGGDVYSFDETDGPHIMAWHPAVALAVADWLDSEARAHSHGPPQTWGADCCRMKQALAVARVYLGDTH